MLHDRERSYCFAFALSLWVGCSAGVGQTLVVAKAPVILTSTAGQIQVTLRVYRDVPGLANLYKWDYEVLNLSFEPTESGYLPLQAAGMADFYINLPEQASELANLSAPQYWNPVIVSWTKSTGTHGGTTVAFIAQVTGYQDWEWGPVNGLRVGQSAHFSFTTGPRKVAKEEGCPLGPPDPNFGIQEISFTVQWVNNVEYFTAQAPCAYVTPAAVWMLGRNRPLGPDRALADATALAKVPVRDPDQQTPYWEATGPLFYAPGKLLPLVRMGTGDSPSDPTTETEPVDDNVNHGIPKANVALGNKFFVQLVIPDKTDPLNSAKFQPITGLYTIGETTITPAAPDSLFPNSTVIEFDKDTPSSLKYFQAIHLGDAKLTLTPQDTTLTPATTINLKVGKPKSLGLIHNRYDTQLVDFAHLRGIPPQLLKGQVKHESNFNPNTYRYEPVATDGDLYRFSGGASLRTQDPYSLYRVAANDQIADLHESPNLGAQLPQGAETASADVAPRTVFRMCTTAYSKVQDACTDGQIQRIPASDDPHQFVSAREVVILNDANQHWMRYASARHRAAIQANPSLLDFTAQTTISASYGLLQILYWSAIHGMKWQGVSGARNPSLLFDTPTNLTNGGGSLQLGTDELRKEFTTANPNLDSANPAIQSSDDLLAAFKNALNRYNHGSTNDSPPYGSGVLSDSLPYTPVLQSTIFKH